MGCCGSAQVDDSSSSGKMTRKKLRNLFAEVDAHALMAPQSASNSTEELAKYLRKDLTDHLLIARSFYRWITDNIKYDTAGFTEHDNDAGSVLRYRTAVSAGYCILFAELCQHAGITVKTITGFAKGYNYNPEKIFKFKHKTNHSWNVFQVKKKWKLIDCTRGAGYVDSEEKFHQEYEEFFFTPVPRKLIITHFPFVDGDKDESKKWQLLNKPWTIQDFNDSLKRTHFAMKWGLIFSHEESTVFVDKSVEIVVEDPRKIMNDMTMHMEASHGRDDDRYVFLRKEKSGIYEATVRPPHKGTFRLQFFSKPDSESDELIELATYIIECTKTDNKVRPYPKNPGLWGAAQAALDIGFDPSVIVPIFHKATKGKLSLTLKTKNLIPTILRLHSSDDDDEDLNNYALLQTEARALTINLRLPRPDFYILEILCPTGSYDQYYPYIAYLIESDFESPEPILPFPKTFSATQDYECKLIEPIDGFVKAKSEVRFRVRSNKLVAAMVGKEKMTCGMGLWEAKITTPKAGQKIQISGHGEDENKPWGLFTYETV